MSPSQASSPPPSLPAASGALSPDFDTFRHHYAADRSQIVAIRVVADLETPVSAFLKLADGQRHAFLLESVEGGDRLGRYSFLGFAPDLLWRCQDGQAALNRQPALDPEAFEPVEGSALDSLRHEIAAADAAQPDNLPPMTSGLVGYLGYDMVRLMERLPETLSRDLPVPDALLIRPTIVCAFDAVAHTLTIMHTVRPQPGISADAAWTLAQQRLAGLLADLERSVPYRRGAPAAAAAPTLAPEAASNTGHDRYLEMVRTAKDYIVAGDIFQVVPSHRLSLPLTAEPFAVYRALRRLNPSPFLFYLTFGDHQVVGSSPEILVRVRDGEVTIRPLAGTRPRGTDEQQDRDLAEQLLADPKERAEHLMLLDLGRNDVGRVAETGSVRVAEQFIIERYSHVMHISSTVVGRLNQQKHDALDALIGGFPAGTVSGAPKIRAMEILEELETSRRQIYGGCVGYFAPDGTMDTCISLRTAVICEGKVHIQAGAGVVYDSDPEAEWQETLKKAGALVRAVEVASGH